MAKIGSVEMLNLFFKALQKMLPEKDLALLIKEKDLLLGCNLLHYICKECSHAAIKETLKFSGSECLDCVSKNGDTCLHSIVMNRKLLLVTI